MVTSGLGCFGVVLGGLGSFLRVPRWYGIVRVLERSGVVWGGLGSFLCVFGRSGVVWDGLGWSGWARLWARLWARRLMCLFEGAAKLTELLRILKAGTSWRRWEVSLDLP